MVSGVLKLMATSNMQLLMIFFSYVGLMFAFWTGVYGPSLSFTGNFGEDRKDLSGLHGIMAQTGGMTVGIVTSLFGNVIRTVPRYKLIILAVFCHFVSYTIILLIIPNAAPLGETFDDAILVCTVV